MSKNLRKELSTDYLSCKKEELEDVRRLLNQNIDTRGFDYQEILAVSQRMDEIIVEYMKLVGHNGTRG
jgi:Spo0E like sporulation regulatory protein.